MGISTRNNQDEQKALIFKESEKKTLEKAIVPVIKLLDLDEEEERDKEAISQFMKKYAKLFKNYY